MRVKLLFTIMLGMGVISASLAQNVPNGGFEEWVDQVLYEEPETWNTGNQQSIMAGVQSALKTTDSYSGDFALRLESLFTEEEIIFGYCFSNGMITGDEVGDTLKFEGGFPIAASPDSLYGYLKYQMAESDTGLLIVSFKSGGEIISQNMFPIIGSQIDYARIGFDLMEIMGTPDTALIAFATSNPDRAMAGGWLQIDSLWFDDVPDVIPNADFENWEEINYTDPAHWVTANYFTALFGGDISATQSTDAHSGTYAIRIEAVETVIPSDEGMEETVGGFAIAFDDGFDVNDEMPSIPIDFNPSELTGYYKYSPASIDVAMIYVILRDSENNEYEFSNFLLPAANYTAFSVPFEYPEGTNITELSILASTSVDFIDGSGSSELGSILFLDDIDLTDPCLIDLSYEILISQEPTCANQSYTLDAGADWDEYLWSTDDTTQEITVPSTEPTTVSVTVTDNSYGCQYSDEIELVSPLDCGGLPVKTVASKPMLVELYPNPVNSFVTLEFVNVVPGEYSTELLDITGKVLIARTFSTAENSRKFRIDLTPYPEGLYLFEVKGNNFTHCERVMKK